MRKISVRIDPSVLNLPSVDDVQPILQEINEKWLQQLEQANQNQLEHLELPGLAASEKMSKNFAVWGLLLRNLNSYLKHHEFPKDLMIVCTDEPSAKAVKVVYNMYIAPNKEERMEDDSWD